MRVVIRATPLPHAGGWEFETSGFREAGTHAVELRGEFPYRAGAKEGPSPDRERLKDIHRMIHTRSPAPSEDDLSALGLHLFEAAIGQAAWKSIEAAAEGAPVEIALQFQPSDYRLARLPWEMMHDGARFLARRTPLVSVVRLAAGPEVQAIEMPLRVLFVVATKPSDERVLAGTEYLGILRRLAESSGGLTHDLVVEATRSKITKAVERFRPSVVHVIGHGTTLAIRLTEEDAKTGKRANEDGDACDAKGLWTAFGAHPPKLVILNVCNAGGRIAPLYGAQTAANATNLADGLVALGIPMVLGMAGRVSDHACRLYARRLYEALAEGYSQASETPLVDIAAACAIGRRAALNVPGTVSSVDWAFPTVTVNAGLSDTTVRLTDKAVRAWAQAGESHYARKGALCDRLDILSKVGTWLSEGTDGSPVLAFVEKPGSAPINVTKAAALRLSDPPDAKVGTSRLLAETAVIAAHAGYLPCLLPTPGMGKLATWRELAEALDGALQETCDKFQHPWNPGTTHTIRVLARLSDPTAKVSPEMEQPLIRAGNQVTETVLCAAMKRDLMALAASLKLAGKRGLLLLLDNIHEWDPLVEQLALFVTEAGVGWGATNVPVALSCSIVKHGRTTEGVKKILDIKRTVQHEVKVFAENHEREVAYRQFLLTHPEGQLIPDPVAHASQVEAFFKALDDFVQGVPSWLVDDREVQKLIGFARLTRVLTEADDAQILAAGGDQ